MLICAVTHNLQHGGQLPLVSSPSTLLLDPSAPHFPLSTISCGAPHCLSTSDIPDSHSERSEAGRYIEVSFPVQEEGVEEERLPPSFTEPSARGTNVSPVEAQMKAVKTKVTIGVLSTLISYVSLNSLWRALDPEAFIWVSEDREDAQWISSSRSWFDRKACRWLGLCGVSHLRRTGPLFGKRVTQRPQNESQHSGSDWDWQNAWNEGDDRPEDWTDDELILREIPHYVLEYAPLVHLYSEEQFWPCDIAEHLYHITPTLNYTALQPQWQHPTLQDLSDLNEWEYGRWVFLTSNDNVEERPEWLEGERNIPKVPLDVEQESTDTSSPVYFPGRTFSGELKESYNHLKEWYQSAHEQDDPVPPESPSEDAFHTELKRAADDQTPLIQLRGGRSNAPAVLITVNKGHGIVDAFWFFFYSFNLGNSVFNVRFGNHVGDWEHNAIRFHHGKPKAVFFSEHNFGSAYSYDAVEKIGKRPVIYSARGTHAMYSTPGLQPYILPWGILHDITDRGPLWDPVLNSHSYTYDYKNDTLRSSNLTPEAPTNWFHFAGHWGDKFYPLGDKRQYRVAGQYHYVNGPLGPKFKDLGRSKICAGPDTAPCVIKNWLGGVNRVRRWQGVGEGDELSATDLEKMIKRDRKLSSPT